ncbi:hypothetical protein SteCoe_19225 [Stentor coeruleus]|uniref:CSC1/OSCA1-like cytosolic domain-containing protein n=1 Tax=Stentor coeruleus TaxID=5963 RepID=A0A1R2BUQ1_9CILI|nr:hypothetical protein SteCoe_19225 [Stentor coeruleus]
MSDSGCSKDSLVQCNEHPLMNFYPINPNSNSDDTISSFNSLNQSPNDFHTKNKKLATRCHINSFINRCDIHSKIAQKELSLLHRKASQAGINANKNECFDKCPCCGYYADKPLFNPFKTYKQYKDLGIAYVLYFEYIALMVIFLTLLFFIVCLPCAIEYNINIGFFGRNEYLSKNSLIEKPKVSQWQITMQSIAIVLIMIFYPILQCFLHRRIISYSDNTLNESSFAIFINNLPSDFTNFELKEHFNKYLPSDPSHYKTLIVINCYELSDIMKIAKKIYEIQGKIKFIETYKNEYNENPKHGFICERVMSLQKLENELKVLEKTKEEILRADSRNFTKKSVLPCFRSKKLISNIVIGDGKSSTYSAFVVFRKISYALMLKRELKFSIFNYLKTKLVPNFLQSDTVYRFKGKYLYTESTPETSDIIWENAVITKCERFFREMITFVLTTAVILFFEIFVFIPLTTISFASKISKGGGDFQSNMILITLLSFMNFLGKKILFLMTNKERHYSHTKFNLSLYKKYVGFMIMNVLLVQYIIFAFLVNEGITWNYVGFLLTSLVMNGIVGPLMSFLYPIVYNYLKLMYYLKVKDRLDMTQIKANSKFELRELSLPNDLANLMLVIFIGLSYLAILPEGILIVIVSIIFQVILLNIKLAMFSKTPRKLDGELILLASESFPWVILLIFVSATLFYKEDKMKNEAMIIISDVAALYLLCLAFGLFRYLKAFNVNYMKRIYQSIIDNKVFFDYYKNCSSNYESENPATCLNGHERMENYIRNTNEKDYVEVDYKYDIFENLKFSFTKYFQ